MTLGNRRSVARARLVSLSCALLVAAGTLACKGSVEDKLEEARTLQELGQIQDAIDVLRGVVARAPDNADANYALGAALVQAGQSTLGIPYLAKAEAADEHAVQAGLLLASAYANGENFEEAMSATARVLARDPHNVGALRIRFTTAAQLGHFQDVMDDADKLLEDAPGDPQALVAKATALMKLGRMADAEKSYFELKQLGEKSGDPATAGKACIGYANFFDESRVDVKRAEREFDACVKTYPNDGMVAHFAMRFYDTHKLKGKSLELLHNAAEQMPDNLVARQEMARRLAAQGKVEEGDKALVEVAELLGSSQAYAALASYRQQQGDRPRAIEAIQKAIDVSPDEPDSLLFSLVDLQVGNNDIEGAEKTLAKIEAPVYKSIGQGRILLAKGDAKGSLAAFDAGLKNWPGNAGARFLAGSAALQLGDKERALREFREATRADESASDAALIAAKLHFERGEFEDASDLADRHLGHRGDSLLEATIILARSQEALGRRAQAEKALREYLKRVPKDPGGIAALAAIMRADKGPAATAQLIESSGLDLSDPANERALRPLAQSLIEQGRAADALAKVDAGLAKHADSAAFHEIRGRILIAQGKADAARSELERALSIQADYAPAEAALGGLIGAGGDLATGIERIDRAAKLDPDTPDYAYQAAQLLLANGKTDDAMQRLRAIVAVYPTHTPSCNDLAWLLAARKQDLDQALALAQRSARISQLPEILDTLGYVQLQRGESAAAIATFQKALEGDPKAAGTHYRLGVALAASGRADDAQRAFRDALGSGPFPEADDARARLAELEHK